MIPFSYTQPTPRSCGPAAAGFALYKTFTKFYPTWLSAYLALVSNWPGGWKDTDTVRDDINDWPDEHRLALEALGFQQHMVTVKDILESKYPNNSVVCLIHSPETHLAKHWVVVAGIQDPAGTTLGLHWGDGKIHLVSIGGFIDLFTRSTPNCAYIISESAPRLSWWQRFRRWALGIISRWT